MRKLFIVCPECCLENDIRLYFGENCYFITALGAVAALFEPSYLKYIERFIEKENIQQIYFMQDLECCFIDTGAYSTKPRFNTTAEQKLINLRKANIKKETTSFTLKMRLCELNIYNSATSWIEKSNYFETKISKNELSIEGIIYHRVCQDFGAGLVSHHQNRFTYVNLSQLVSQNKNIHHRRSGAKLTLIKNT